MDLSNLSKNLPPTKSLEQVSLRNLNSELTDEFKNAAKSVATLYNASLPKSDDHRSVKTEFATAAKAVASLYRLGTNSNVLLMHKGYLECLDDLLSVIAHGEDIENWALTKRAEITNYYNHKEPRDDQEQKEGTEKEGSDGKVISAKDAKDPTEKDPTEKDPTEKDLNEKDLNIRDIFPVPLSADSDSLEFGLPAEYDFTFPEDLASHIPFHAGFSPLSISYKRSKNHIDLKHRKSQSLSSPNDSNNASSEGESDTSDSSSDADVRKKRKALKVHQDTVKKRKRDISKRDPGQVD